MLSYGSKNKQNNNNKISGLFTFQENKPEGRQSRGSLVAPWSF